MSNEINLPPIPAGYATEVCAAMRNYARSAVEAHQRQQWRNPDTAPKDSSFVLVSAFGEVWMGAFHNGGWIISNPRSTMGDVDIDGWQPLPPPPETI